MKKIEIKNKVVARGGGTLGSPSKGAAMDLSAYLLASVFAEAFEYKETTDGTKYLSCKLPLALQYDLIAFANEGNFDLPTLFDGLVIDNDSIYWDEVVNDAGEVVKVLKAKAGEGTIKELEITGEGNALTKVDISEDGKRLLFVKEKEFAEKKYADETFLKKENVDSVLDEASENPVQNKAVAAEFKRKIQRITSDAQATENDVLYIITE